MLQKMKIIISYVYILLCSSIMALFAQSNPFQTSFMGDSAVFVYVAKVILSGGMPYRDTFDHKGPLIYLFDALGLLIDNRVGIWIVEFTVIFITFLFAYKIARFLKCSQLLSCVVITIGFFVLLYYFQGGNLTEEYASVFITVSLYYFLKFIINCNIKKHQIILTGSCFAAVCMLRANMIACWLVLFMGILLKCFSHKKYKLAARFIGWFVIGILLVFVPIIVWLCLNSSFGSFIDDYIIFNFIYSNTLALSKFNAFLAFISTPPMLVSETVLFYFCVKQSKKEDWLCLSALFLSVVLAGISGRKYGHYGMIFYPFIIYATSRLFYECWLEICMTKAKNKFSLKNIIIPVAIALCFSGCIIYPIVTNIFNGNSTIILYPSDNIDSVENRKIIDVIQLITNENDKISVVGNDNSLYLLANRKSVSKYSYQYPIANIKHNIWEEYLNDIQKSPAKVIVLTPGADQIYPYCGIKVITDKYYRLVSVVSKTEIYLLK